jgi:hypothetical protein
MLLATELYSRLARGPRPAAIPTRVWAGVVAPPRATSLPPLPSLDQAERNVVIVLVDQSLFESRKHWKPYFDALAQVVRHPNDIVLPVSIFGDAHRVSTTFHDINHVRVADPETVAKDDRVFQAILTVILRSIVEQPPSSSRYASGQDVKAVLPRVFFCHCKADGDPLARDLRWYLHEHTQLNAFFDIHDIPHGSGVRNAIKSAISESCLLVIWTDRLLESRWCQFEILEARSQQRPLLVLDALSVQAPRVFPFLSNMPVVRWRNDAGEVISSLLLELVRTHHIRLLFESLSSQETPTPRFMLHPPDIMEASSVLVAAGRKTATPTVDLVVYPDPPLPAEELTFLGLAFPSIHLHSLSEWTALRSAGILSRTVPSVQNRPCPLTGLSIGVSVSSAESWTQLGLIAEHQDDYIVDIARQLILLGARLLWGGDLRPEGLGRRLESLVQVYHQADHAPQDHIACYLAWPNHRGVSPKDLQERRTFADVLCLPNLPPVAETSITLNARVTPDAQDAVCFSLMRRQLATESQARIILGGKLTGYRGRYPGIVEESLESILSGGALYIVGGFGGASRAVYDAIAQNGAGTALDPAWSERCKDEVVQQTNAAYDELAQALNLDLRVDHPTLLQHFREFGLDGLSNRNGLSEAENLRLACSQDLHEIIALLVQGLAKVARLHPAPTV